MRLRTAHLACLLVLLSVVGGCALSAAHASALPAGEYGFSGYYIGVLLCQDCSGIWTEITLRDHGPDWGNGEGDFTLLQRFTGGIHGGETITLRGQWSAVSWVRDGSYTGVLELRPAEQSDGITPAPLYFFSDHGRSLRLLGSDRQSISTLQPVTLKRVIPPPVPEFKVDISHPDSIIYGRVGDTFDVDLPVASLAAYRTAWTMKPPASHAVKLYSVTGSGDRNIYTADFTLKATATGMAQLRFEMAANSDNPVILKFQIQP